MAFELVIIDSALNCIIRGDRLWEGFAELSHNLLLAIMKLCSYELGQLFVDIGISGECGISRIPLAFFAIQVPVGRLAFNDVRRQCDVAAH
ncbi:hypothetical protein D3C74_442180 [compost metagenome]